MFMLEILNYILIFFALIGSSVSAYIDLKTTEIPDEIPIAMVTVALLLRFGYSIFSGEWEYFLIPLAIGSGFFLFGMLMYFTGQWGGGDAKLLGAVGVMIGFLPGVVEDTFPPFFLNYLLNLFFIGAIYIIIYALVVAARNKKVRKGIFKYLKKNKTELYIIVIFSAVFLFTMTYSFWSIFGNIELGLNFLFPFFLIGFYFLWVFLKCVERIGFMKRISTKDLREGDMIGEDIKELNISKRLIRGLTKEEVRKIRKLKRKVWIREGVRFGPVFPISILVTLFYGNVVLLLLNLI